MYDTWLASVLLLVHAELAKRGLDADAVARSAGVEPSDLRDANARLPHDKVRDFWVAAVAACDGDPCFGLDVVSLANPTTLHALGFAVMASGTLREATERLRRYTRIVLTIDNWESRQEPDVTWLVFQSTDDDASYPRSFDARLGLIVRIWRILAGKPLAPKAVRMRHLAPAESLDRIVSFFGVMPEYEAGEYALAFANDDLDQPLPGGNPELALAAEKVAADYLARQEKDDVVLRVRRTLIELLPSGQSSRAIVASKLSMSERTLQRRLTERGMTYAGLLDDLRRDLAADYLRNSRTTVQEAAYLLGFAEVASFNRAFRRWMGASPSQWREEATQTS
ncbi:MAG: AraC family transcriptional regulator [Rhodocyclaceae bacterium]